MIMSKFIGVGVLMFIVTFTTLAPGFALAQTQTTYIYQPRTQAEMIAFLYGRIAQLLEIKEMLERGGTISTPVHIPIESASATTRSATDISANTAILRGEVNLYGGATARVWFEYGIEQDFLDQKTRQVTVRSAYDRAVRTQVSSLRDDTRYYFRIVSQDNKGVLNYGPVYSFRTDEL